MNDFLKHPKYQYIPISVRKSIEGAWKNPFNSIKADLFVCQNVEELTARLSQYRLPQLELTPEDLNGYMAIISLNFLVKRGYFRFVTTKFIGERKEGRFQVFFVTKKYLPKRLLHFTLVTEAGESVAWKNVKIL